MARYNVRSNCISPFAWGRLFGTVPTDTPEQQARVEKIKQMTPEKIAPLATALFGDAAQDVTGQIFAVRNNEIFLMSQSGGPSAQPTPPRAGRHKLSASAFSVLSNRRCMHLIAPPTFLPGILFKPESAADDDV